LTSRRDFLKVSLAASALPVAARAEIGFVTEPTIPLYKVLYDTRFPASVAFAERAAARGLDVHAMRGDMTSFWYDDLYYRWQQGPAAIAGLTAHGALFCLERLAWDQRMRVVFRGEHSVAADGCVAHRFEGTAPLVSLAARAAVERSSWPAELADIVAECPVGGFERRATQSRAADAATLLPSAALFSWIIAPVVRA
jgi:hypothetical protein